jgi:hypothetical protein
MPIDWRFVRGRMIQEGLVALMRGPFLFTFSDKLNAEVLKKCPEPRDLALDPTSICNPILDDSVRPNGQKVIVKAWTNPERTGAPVDVVLTEFVDPNGIEVYFKIPNLNEIQLSSYNDFLQLNVSPSKRRDQGLQAALNAAEKKGPVCFLPAGQYRIDGSLVVPAGVTLCGASGGVPHSEHPIGTVLLAYGGKGRADGERLRVHGRREEADRAEEGSEGSDNYGLSAPRREWHRE